MDHKIKAASDKEQRGRTNYADAEAEISDKRC